MASYTHPRADFFLGRSGLQSPRRQPGASPLDDGRILNADDHLDLPAATPADFNVDREDAFEA
jgi:hypothetical protein